MPRRTPLALAAILIAGSFAAARAQTRPGPAPAAPAGLPVRVELVGGEKFAGGLKVERLAVNVDYGTLSLRLDKVKAIDFAPRDAAEGGGTSLGVTFLDKSRLAATLEEGYFAVETAPGQSRTVAAREVAALHFDHPHDDSTLALLVGLLTLTFMEIILGVDNVIFLAIQAGKLPEEQRPRARTLGLAVALGTRVLLLLSLSFLLGLTRPLFVLPPLPFFESMEARAISLRDLILFAGGLFLIGKSTFEMHERLETARDEAAGHAPPAKRVSFVRVIVMIALIDIVFSLDSVITAVGMVESVAVMIAAMVLAMLVMLAFAGPIGRFVDGRPTVKVLALSFLILIGVMLVAEGLGQHIDKGYIYFAMAFAVGVEVVNLKLRKSPSEPAGLLPRA